jgi:hypothetical protein
MSDRYYELAIEGPTGRTLGFVQGFLAGHHKGRRVLDAYQEGFDTDTLRERLREFFRPSMQTYHLLVPEDLVTLVEEAVQEGVDRGMDIEIRDKRPLTGARFPFSFQIFSREHGARCRSLFDPPPEGITCEDASFREVIHPEAKGVEAYAPAHHYELTGEGTVEGEVTAVLELHRTCRDEELIKQGDLEVIPLEDGKG